MYVVFSNLCVNEWCQKLSHSTDCKNTNTIIECDVILNRVIVLLFDGEDVMMQEKKTTMCIRKRTSQNANRRHHKFCHFQDSTLRDSSQTAPTHDCIIREKLLSKNYIVAQVRIFVSFYYWGSKLSEQRLFLKFFLLGLVKDLQMDIILKHMSKSPETTVGTETPLNFLRTFFSFAGGVEKTLWTQKF